MNNIGTRKNMHHMYTRCVPVEYRLRASILSFLWQFTCSCYSLCTDGIVYLIVIVQSVFWSYSAAFASEIVLFWYQILTWSTVQQTRFLYLRGQGATLAFHDGWHSGCFRHVLSPVRGTQLNRSPNHKFIPTLYNYCMEAESFPLSGGIHALEADHLLITGVAVQCDWFRGWLQR